LTKNIPVGAGLGGGSSDAAATLLALSGLWGLDWAIDRLAPIAEKLGSDVSFFLDPRPAMMRGRGERIEPVTWAGPDLESMWIALVVPAFSLSTADVYRRHAEIATPVELRVPFDPGIAACRARVMMDLLFNDLEPAAFACEPRLAELHSKLSANSDRPIRMSGSGSALYSLFDMQDEANSWAAGLMEVCKSTCDIRIVRPHTPA
jgi:4-diphosphocytidyl-2C-methyl-D-erythritol kinase